MSISIIIPTFHRNTILHACLNSILQTSIGKNCQIIVVNDSPTNTVDLPHAWKSHVSLLRNTGQGVASARNFGARQANHKILLFIDDDMLVTREALQYVLQFHESYPSSALNVNWKYPPHLYEKIKDSNFGRYIISCGHTTLSGWLNNENIDNKGLLERNSLASFFLSVTKRDFDLIGGYDERFPHAGAEDYDFPQRLKRVGIKFFLNSDIFVYHNEEDKVIPEVYLKRYFYAGKTRRIAAELGYNEMAVKFGAFKTRLIKALSPFNSVLQRFARAIPQSRTFDKIYFRLIYGLVAINLYQGYHYQEKSKR